MGARRGRSYETALETLVDAVHIVWGCRQNNVATLLLLDMAGAFDHVSYRRLIYNLRIKGVPKRIISWVESFLIDRYTSLTLGTKTSSVEKVETGIPQGLLILPILFLFFNTLLIEAYTKSKLRLYIRGFVDDIHLLAYSNTTETNCKILEQAYQLCLE